MPGVEFRKFCGIPDENNVYCSNEAVGEITVQDGELTVDIPVCQSHIEAIERAYSEKVDTLGTRML